MSINAVKMISNVTTQWLVFVLAIITTLLSLMCLIKSIKCWFWNSVEQVL